MVRGIRSLGVLLGILLAGCGTGAPPGVGAGVESEDIIGGTTDSTDHSVFGILINNDALCSGSLIAPNLLLTARHCVAPVSSGEAPIDCTTTTFGTPFSPSSFVATWTTDLNSGIPQNSVFHVQDVRVPTSNKLCGNDVALLILDDVVAAATAPTIEPRVDSPPVTPEAYSAIGYGLNNANDTQGTSAGVRRSSVGNLKVGCVGSECGTPQILADEWGANSPMCSGDSGGPALDSQGRVIGVASRADDPCAVGFYSQVAPWKDLIVTAANDAATLGGYDVPTWAGGEPMDGGAPQAGSSAGGSTSTGGSNATGGTATGGTAGGTASGGRGGSANAGQSNGGGRSNASGGRAATTPGRGGRGAGTAGSSTAAAGRSTGTGTGGSAGTDLGLPDDAGAPPPDAGTLTSGSLGDECNANADCTDSLVCYATNSKPPGSCVPACSATKSTCPSGYACVVSVGACAPQSSQGTFEGDNVGKASGGCGCRVTPEGDAAAHAWQSLGVLALLGAFVRRRQIAPGR